MAHDVFVSYSTFDKATADAVCALLEARGIRCWIAPRDILPGVSWAEAIIDAIEESRVMVLVFSAKANSSQQIQREVERAVHNGVTIIPLRIEDAKPSKTMEYFISTPHWLDALSPPLESHIQRLADGLRTLLSRPDARVEAAATAKMRAYQPGQGTGTYPASVPPTGERQTFSPPATAERQVEVIPPPAAPPPPVAEPWPPPEAAWPEPPKAAVPVQATAVASPPVPAPGAGASLLPTPALAPAAAPAVGPAAPPAAGTLAAPTSPAATGRTSGRPFSGMQLGAAAAVVLLVAAVIVGVLMRRPSAPSGAAGEPSASAPGSAAAVDPGTPASATPAVPSAAALAVVIVDAAPWARVSINPVDGGTAPKGDLVTPLSVQLAPGEYDLVLENGGVTQPQTHRVKVAANQPNAFRFTMPGFEAAKVVQALRSSEVGR